MTARPCPFCGTPPQPGPMPGTYTIIHDRDCFLWRTKVIFADKVERWNRRAKEERG